MEIPTVLAFDFGLSRIGAAVSFGTLAEPLKVIANNDETWNEIGKLIEQYHPDRLLVGVSEQEMAKLSQEFGDQLAEYFSLPVGFYDETLSSAEVLRKLYERDRNHKKYKGPIDHYAATLILQNYLDENYV